MRFSYRWLQSFFRKKLPRPEKLAEILTIHSFEVSEVSKVKGFPLSGQKDLARGVAGGQKSKADYIDYILDIEVLPNRGSDCFSHLGIAREISAITGQKCRYLTPTIKEDRNLRSKDFLKIVVKDKEACPRYTARIITDVKVGPSPKWIRERLEVCGLRPINNIVDIANYLMLETGQPLHAFDFDKIEGENSQSQIPNLSKKIIVRFAREGEKIVTLDKEKYELDKNILVISDAKKPLAIAGIKGGLGSEIDKKTTTIVLESANFEPRIIRQASKRIDLKTDASWRFEHGIDPNLTEFAINRAAYFIQEIAGGKVAQGLIDFYPKKVLPKKINLDLDYVERLLGVKISQKEIKNILKRLNFKLYEKCSRRIEVEVPTRRLDISIPEDLIEEIGRIYGYQKIPSVFPKAILIPPERNLDIFWEDFVKNILKEVGFFEVYNYSFISEREKDFFPKEALIELENPLSSQFKYLRPSLIPHLLNNVQKNQKNFKEIKIFELGKIFRKISNLKSQKSNILEKKMLTGLMTGDAFYQAKGVIDVLLNKMGISNIWYDSYQPTPEDSELSFWQPKRSAEIKVNHQEIGFLGEISPSVLESFKIENKIVIFEIDFEKLKELASEEQEFRIISPYPAAMRDIAILVPRQVLVEEVLNKIELAGGKLIRDIDLFDIYEGEEIPEGKKSLAFHIIYQAPDRTLSSEEIDEIQNRIIQFLEAEIGWEVRR